MKKVRVEDVSDICRGSFLRHEEHRISQGMSGVPIITLSDILSSSRSVQYLYATRESLRDHKSEDERVQLLPRGTVLIPTFGLQAKRRRIAIAGIPVVASRQFVGLVPHREIESRYLAWTLFHAIQSMSPETASFNTLTIHLRTLKRIPFTRRTLSEQIRIADTLDSADVLTSKCSYANTMAQRILQAIFVSILGNPATHSSPWPIHQLGEVCQIVAETIPPRRSSNQFESRTQDIPLLEALSRDDYVVDGLLDGQPSPGLQSQSGALPPGTIVITNRSTVSIALSQIPVHLYDGDIGLVCRPSVDPWYIFAWLKLASVYIQSLKRHRKHSHLSPDVLRRVQIPVPPLDLQYQFGEAIEHLEGVLVKIQNKECSLQLLVRSLCSNLLLDADRAVSPDPTEENLPQ